MYSVSVEELMVTLKMENREWMQTSFWLYCQLAAAIFKNISLWLYTNTHARTCMHARTHTHMHTQSYQIKHKHTLLQIELLGIQTSLALLSSFLLSEVTFLNPATFALQRPYLVKEYLFSTSTESSVLWKNSSQGLSTLCCNMCKITKRKQKF